MKYVIIAENRSTLLSVGVLCRAFQVSRAGFYEWIRRCSEPTKNDDAEKELESNVIRVHFDSRRTYGYRKVHAELANQGIHADDKKVYSLMRTNGLKAKTKKPYKPQTTKADPSHRVSPRVFDNDTLLPERPNHIWCGDITYVGTREGWLYLSVFIDLFSRMVVGWAIDDHMRTQLVRDSFVMAVKNRSIDTGLIVHTDRGSQYSADEFRGLLSVLELTQSMSRKGNCYDNAYVESFFAQMKKELSKKLFDTKQEAMLEIARYIEDWYNPKRVHSSIGYLSPSTFEARFEAVAS